MQWKCAKHRQELSTIFSEDVIVANLEKELPELVRSGILVFYMINTGALLGVSHILWMGGGRPAAVKGHRCRCWASSAFTVVPCLSLLGLPFPASNCSWCSLERLGDAPDLAQLRACWDPKTRPYSGGWNLGALEQRCSWVLYVLVVQSIARMGLGKREFCVLY